MRTPLRNQPSQFSQMLSLNSERQSIGIMTPVHIQNIIKDRNLDYLENLGELAERMNVNPVWYEYETPENKMKLLEIYQLSINYARNTADLYKDVLNDLNDKQYKQRLRLNKLKSDILSHKQKTTQLKKNLRREKLHLEKERAANYEKKLRKMKKELQKQLELKQQQQSNSQTSELMTERRKNQSFQHQAHQHPPPQSYPPGYPYPYPYPPPMNYPQPPPPQYYYNYYPYQNQMPMQTPQNVMGAHLQGVMNHKNNDRKQMIDQSFTKQIEVDEEFKKMSQNRVEQDELSLMSIIKDSKKTESAVVKKSSKIGFSKKEDPIRQSNVESQKGDIVEDLNKLPKSSIVKRGESSAVSRKSSNSQLFDDSQLEMLKLNTQSKNDLEDGRTRPKFQKQTSIANSLSSIQKKKTIQNTPINKLDIKQPQQSNTKYFTVPNSLQKKQDNIDTSDNKIQIKITKQKEKPKQQQSDYMNRLAQSNQGPYPGGLNAAGGFNGRLKLRQQTGNVLRNSIANSLDDDISKQGSRVKLTESEQVEEYPQDFQEVQNQLDPNKIENTRVCIMTSSDNSSPEKNKSPLFVPLAKNYFILKDDFQALQQSNSNPSSMLGSLKQFNFKFISSQRRKTYQDRSNKGGPSDDGGDFLQLIDMPENSVIAKPSKLKHSTIRKSTVQQKINKSYEPKVPTQFIQQTPAKNKKEVKFKQNTKVPDVDDNFQKIDQLPQLKNKNLQKNLQVPQKQSFLKSEQIKVDMAQSQMIDQANNPSLQLQIIPQSQNQSYNNEKNIKLKILSLMDKKYEQRSSNFPRKFDKNLIKKQINSIIQSNKGEDPTYGQLTDIFEQLYKKTETQKNKLIMERIKRMQELKEMKDDSSRPSSKQNSTALLKNGKKNQDSNISKKTGMQRQEDDLTYSRSMVQNKPDNATTKNLQQRSQIIKKQQKSLDIGNPKKQSISNKSDVALSQQISSKPPSQLSTKPSQQGKQSKFLRQKKQGSSNESARLLNQLKQKSKFDRDDEIAVQIKKTTSKTTNAIKQQDDQDF